MATPDPFSPIPELDPFAPAKAIESPLVTHGRRNLATGQGFQDERGPHTILSGSVQDSRLNQGRPTVIPFVYEGREVSPREAIERAIASGIVWPSADTEEEATRISIEASEAMNAFGDFPSFAPVEGTRDNLDDDRDISVGEFLRQYLNTIKGVDYRSPEAQSVGELLEPVPGVSLTEIGEGAVAGGQAAQRKLRSNVRGLLLAQAFDVMGQTASGTLEMFAGATPDEVHSITYNAARTIREATRTPEDAQTGFVEDYFTRPLLQTASFMFGGRAAQKMMKETPKMAGAIAAWLGAGVGSQAGREDAVRHGATEEQMAIAFSVNGLFGLTEGLPIGIMLNRIDDSTGGIISRKIKSKAGQVIAGGAMSAIEEGLQETGQTFGENWTAKDLAQYDPTRSYSENMFAAAATGGSIGFLLGMVTTAMGGRSRAAIERDIKEKILDPLGANSLDEIAGPVSIIEEHLQRLEESEENIAFLAALEERGEVDPKLFTEMKKAKVAMKERFPGIPGITEGTALLEVDVTQYTTMEAVTLARAYAAHKPERLAEILTAVPTAEIHGAIPRNIVDLIADTNVIIAISEETTRSRQQLSPLNDIIRDYEARTQPLSELDQGVLEEARLKKEALEARLEVNAEMAQDIKTLAEELLPLLGKGATIVIEDSALSLEDDPAVGRYGAAFVKIGGVEVFVNYINLRTEDVRIAAATHATHKTEATQKFLETRKTSQLATVLHEFGHAIAFNRINGLFQKTLMGKATEEETKLFNAVRNDYLIFIRDNLNAPIHMAQAAVKSLARFTRDSIYETGLDTAADVATYFDTLVSEQTLDARASAATIDYLFGFQEYMAEQTAKIGLEQSGLVNPEALPFFKDAWKATNQALEKANKIFKNQAPTLEAFYKSHGIRQQIKSLSQIVGDRLQKDPIHAIFNEGLLTKEQADRLLGEEDTFNWFMDAGFNVLQIAEQNPHLVGLQNYVQHLDEWKSEVNNNLAVAEGRLSAWKELGKKENEKLGRILYDETIGRLPDGGWLADPREFTDDEIAKYGLSEAALELRQGIKEDFRNSLNEMEGVLIAAKKRIFANDIIEQTREVNKVKKEFADMRSRPYFPLMRFGDYILQVRSIGDQTVEGKEYTNEQLIDYQTFDTQKERDKALVLARRHYAKGSATVSASHRVTPNFSLQGMPMTLLEHLENKLTSSKHSEEVSEAISEAMRELKNDALPFRSFRKQFQRRKRVEGYSMDARRSYANYMTSFSNHIARVKFDHLFKEDFDNVQNSIGAINRREGGDSTKRAKILNHMNSHLNYVMNPVNEFVGLRSAAFFWFLGFNVKSAFVNLTQVPLVTYPWLAARYGDGKAVAELTRANGTAIASMTKKDIGDPELYAMIERGLGEGWLSESLATELALAASEKNLDRTLPRNVRQRVRLQVSHYGSLLFATAEKFNRHVTAIAAYRLARAAGRNHEGGIAEAKSAVKKTQFVYARWARPRFMRGKVGGTVFVFQNYMQNALYFALGGDPGAFRMMIMLFLLSGVMGLPFAENIADLVDAAMTALKRRTGMKDPHTQVRVELRELLNDMDVNADLFLHGMSSSSFGFANIGEFMGWPIPDLDLSGSLSMGRIVPGTQLLRPGFPRTVESTVKGALEFGSGAVGSAGIGILSNAVNEHPDTWKSWEKSMPAAMRQISKAARMATRGGEETRSGRPISVFDMHDTKDQGEIIGQALGFTPREVSKGWEGFIAQQQAVIYYDTWRSGLLRQWNYAKETNDQEAVKGVNKEIREYNSIVPFPEMKVGTDTRIQSYEAYIRTRQFSKAEIEQKKPFRRLAGSIEEVFKEEEKED